MYLYLYLHLFMYFILMLIVVHIAARWVQDRVHGNCQGSIMSKGRFYRSAIHLCLHGALITNTPTLWIHIIYQADSAKHFVFGTKQDQFSSAVLSPATFRSGDWRLWGREKMRGWKSWNTCFDDFSKLETSWDWKKMGWGSWIPWFYFSWWYLKIIKFDGKEVNRNLEINKKQNYWTFS